MKKSEIKKQINTLKKEKVNYELRGEFAQWLSEMVKLEKLYKSDEIEKCNKIASQLVVEAKEKKNFNSISIILSNELKLKVNCSKSTSSIYVMTSKGMIRISDHDKPYSQTLPADFELRWNGQNFNEIVSEVKNIISK